MENAYIICWRMSAVVSAAALSVGGGRLRLYDICDEARGRASWRTWSPGFPISTRVRRAVPSYPRAWAVATSAAKALGELVRPISKPEKALYTEPRHTLISPSADAMLILLPPPPPHPRRLDHGNVRAHGES